MKSNRKGITLIETAVAMAVIGICAVAGLSYQYQGARQMRTATVMLSGMRIGQMLLEDWKSAGAVDSYDPVKLNMGFQKSPQGNNYIVTMDGQEYYIWLEHGDLATDSVSNVTLREIKCTIRWKASPGAGGLSANDPTSVFSTYVRVSQD